MKMYDTLPVLEVLQGGCITDLSVDVYDNGEITAYPGSTMRAIIAEATAPTVPILVKNCSSKDGADFTLTLDSTETEKLCGQYLIHFELWMNAQERYKGLAGRLIVHPAAQGERLNG